MNQTKSTPKNKGVFIAISILWIIWGLVHVLAGVMTIIQSDGKAILGIADAVAAEEIATPFHAATNAVINQHGFNLLWLGAVTTVCGILIIKQSRTALLFACICGGFADLGYFIFMDLGGFVHFMPGTFMTIICAVAILLTIWLVIEGREEPMLQVESGS